MKRRIFAFFLSMVMLFGSMPTAAFATDGGGEGGTISAEPSMEASAPTTQATEAPTTEATSAPTTQATEAPTTEATSAPTTQATEAPTTEVAAETTTEASTQASTSTTAESTGEISSETTTGETTEETQAPSVPIDSRFTLGSHGLHITAAEGVFPGGAAVEASLHQSFEIGEILMGAVSDLELFAAFDIQVVGEDGTALQPNGTVYVDVHTPTSLHGMEGATVCVYYVNIAERTAAVVPSLVDFETGMVSFAVEHFSTYAITVSDVPQCICENLCTPDASNAECPVCSADASACWGAPAILTVEELAALFAALPDCSTVTFETSQEEKNAIFAQLDAAMNAYYALMDADFETCTRFEQEYEALIRNAQLLNDALTGNNWVPYAAYYNAAYDPNGSNVTITLPDTMVDQAPTVVRYANDAVYVYQVVKLTSAERTYAFTRNSTSGSVDYLVTGATVEGANFQKTISGSTSSTTMTPISTDSGTTTFKLFYIYSNEIQQPYHSGGGNAKLYGPSGDDTAMVQVTVNTAQLRQSPYVTFGADDNVQWYFTPNLAADGTVSLENAKSFWNTVVSCMNESSRTAFYNTGVADDYVGYILKYESSWWNSYYHGDGVLHKEEKPYVAELHEQKNGSTVYFGSVVGQDKRYADVLDLCDQNLGGEVTWDTVEPFGTSIGYFYRTQNNVQTTIKVTVTQMDSANSSFVRPGDSDIRYVAQNNGSHYLARYKMVTETTTETTVSVTYTDGGAGVFANVTYPYVLETQRFPAFPGSTAREGHTFLGWKCSVDQKVYTDVSQLTVPDGVTSVTLTAQWEPITYTVLWKDKDGTVLETDTNVPYGATPTYDGTLPGTKQQTGYDEVFTGWTPAVTRVSGDPKVDIVYTAAYSQMPHQYNVVWKNFDGTVLETDTDVNYGTTPTYNGAAPQRAEDDQYTYQFSGWNPVVEPVKDYQEYVAQYTATTKNYTITWLDDNGRLLKTDLNVPYGTTPSYDQENPTKADTAEFTYAFKGWSPAIAIVTGDAVYRAEYTETRRSYTVKWKHEDGKLLDTDTVPYGEMPSYDGQIPTKEGDAQYTYTFDKWSPEVKAVTGNAEYTATFAGTVNQYTVTWNYQGTQKQEVDRNVPYGTVLSFGDWDNLNYESANYIYTFTGWKRSGEEILYKTQDEVARLKAERDVTLTAQYTSQRKGHDITVKVIVDPVLENGNFISGKQVTMADVMGEEPGMYLKGPTTAAHELVLSSTTKDYVATLVPNGEYSLYLGTDMGTPYSPYTLLVDGMDRERNLYFYSVTYDPDGGTMEGGTVSYHRGAVAVTDVVPTKEGNTFLGWQVEGTDRVLKAGDALTANIQQPCKLIALWGNVRVDVHVTVKHAVYKTDGSLLGSDQHPGELKIKLAYRNPQNAGEDYVEVVGAETQSYTGPYDTGEPYYTTQVTVDDVYTGLDNRHVYSANALLNGYTVESKTVTKAAGTDNHYIVQIVLQYNPQMFTLQYEVEADSAMEQDMIPSAVDVKLMYLHDGVWDTISAHDNYSVDVEIRETRNQEQYPRFGTGSYPAPVFDANGNTRYYRVAAVGFTIGEGRDAVEMTATGGSGDDAWVFTSNAAPGQYSPGAYTAKLTFTAENTEHQGACGTETDPDSGIYAQHGQLKLLVQTHPADLQLNLNYGTENPVYDTVEGIFVVPDLANYVPTREGYTFMGWYKDAACETAAEAGDYLDLTDQTKNVLYAKWSADITVEGTVTVANTYILGTEERKLYDHDLLPHATVRVLNEQGLQIAAQTVTIDYPVDADGKVNGFGSIAYKITGIPNNGTKYYLDILQSTASYYTALYQNEVDPNGQVDNLSLDKADSYNEYYANRNRVALGTTEPVTATVNAFLRFVPVNFSLDYTIDASAISQGFRPDLAHVLVFADSDASANFAWNVISQMIDDGVYVGQQTSIGSNGIGSGSYPVWQNFGDGTLYNYAAGSHKIRYYPDGDGKAVTVEAGSDPAFLDTLPFAISYDPGYTYYSAHGADADQARILNIILTPKEYPITYVTNGGTMPADYPTDHTWSKPTVVRNAVPQRPGYTFAGWYEDEDLNEASGPVAMLEGNRRMATTLYAKWTADDFAIAYDLQGGTEPGNPISYNIETETFVLKHPTRDGFTFEGWTGTGLTDVSLNVVIPKGSTGDRSYTAHWERNRYAITVTVENGSSTPGGNLTVLHGNDQTIQFAPKSASYALDTVTVNGKPAELAGNGSFTFEDVTAEHAISVVYSTDGNQDGTPDRYQARVTYEVQNGTFKEGEHTSADKKFRLYTIDLKKNVDGVWMDINPAPTLKGTIPTVESGDLIPDAGYHANGHWRETPTEDMVATDGAHYLFHFNERITYYIQYYPTGQMVDPQYSNGIFHGTGITVDPNGGQWTYTWADGKTETYAAAHDFLLDQNMHLGAAQREHYVFDGWEHSAGTGDITHVYTAKWVPEEYTITYIMPYGFLSAANPSNYTIETPTITLNNPTRAGYTFQGWEDADTKVVSNQVQILKGSHGNREFTAMWQAKTDTPYTVRYFFEVLNPGAGEAKYAEDAQLKAALPLTGTTNARVTLTAEQKPQMDHYTINEALSVTSGSISGNGSLVLSVYYDRVSYPVTWKNADGTVLETDTVKYGDLPSYDGEVPTKAGDAQYSYTFTGWDNPTDRPIAEETVFTARYAPNTNSYTITWLDEDGTLLDTDTVAYGHTPSYSGETPTKASSARYEYTFDGWTPEIVSVTGDMTYQAVYTTSDRLYTAAVQFTVDGSNAAAEQMEAILDGDRLYLGGIVDSTMTYVPLTAVEDAPGSYTADVIVGTYHVYRGSESGKTPVSSRILLSVVSTKPVQDTVVVPYYSLSYYDGYSNTLLKTEYLMKGQPVKVNYPDKPTRTQKDADLDKDVNWHFKGWQQGDGTKLLQHGDSLTFTGETTGIQSAQILTAQWSNVRVDVQVTVRHAIYHDDNSIHGKDQEPGDLRIDLTYQNPQNENEPFVEVVGAKTLVYGPDTWKENGEVRAETTVEATGVYIGLDDGYLYSANALLNGYKVERKTVSPVQGKTDHYLVEIVLQYDPDLFVLEYSVETDEAMAKTMIPSAVDVKILYQDGESWQHITAHENGTVDVDIDPETGKGTGSYSVPATYYVGDQSHDRFYRIRAVGFTIGTGYDAVELNATGSTGSGQWKFTSGPVQGMYSQGAYTATLFFNGNSAGAHATLIDGTYHQDGDLKLYVQAHPTDLVLNWNDGSDTPQTQTIEDVFVVPDLENYVPTREGYTFMGWYKDAACETAAEAGDYLNLTGEIKNVLYAKWNANFNVVVNVEDVTTASSGLAGDPSLSAVEIVLQKHGTTGAQIGEPVRVTLDNKTGTHTFANVPNDGSLYYVDVNLNRYEITFHNENSAENAFTADAKDAVDGPDTDTTATVDVRVNLVSDTFPLDYQVDASALGGAFRPASAPVLIMGDTDPSDAYSWKTLYENNAELVLNTPLTDGIGQGKHKVWKYNFNTRAHIYAIRLDYLMVDTDGNGTAERVTVGVDGTPFTVQYVYPAWYREDGTDMAQSQLLKATVTPKKSTITLDAAGGTLTLKDAQGNTLDGSTVEHTWSHPTVWALEITREGYYFQGWADETGKIVPETLADSDRNKAMLAAGSEALTVGAALYGDTKLTAVWSKIETVNFRGGDRMVTYNGKMQTVEFPVYSDLPAGFTFSGLTCTASGKNVTDMWDITFTEAEGGIRIFNKDKEDVTHLYTVDNKTPGKLTVNKAVLTVTAKDIAKTYDGRKENGFDSSITGFLGQDAETVVEGDVTYTGDAVHAVAPGTYTITPVVSDLTADNYTFVSADGTLTIGKAVINATLAAESKQYDGTDAVNAYTITIRGKVEGDSVDIDIGTIAFASEDVGVRKVTATDLILIGENAEYYDLKTTQMQTEAQITPKNMTVWLSPVSRKYDGTTTVDIVFRTATGILPNDQVSIVNIPGKGTLSGSKDAGLGKTVTVAYAPTLSGADSGNYTLRCQVDTVDITPRTVVLATESASKFYDGVALTAIGYSVGGDGFVEGEVANLRTTGSNVGSDAEETTLDNGITYEKVDGYQEGNYKITAYLGKLTVYPDKNDNGISDTTETKYTVTYLAKDTDLGSDVSHGGLLTGMDIPAPPEGVKAANDNGYRISGWKLVGTGKPSQDNTIAEASLIYEAVLEARIFTITYVLDEDVVNPAVNPTGYTYGVGVASFAAPTREKYVFAGWYLDGQSPITAITEEDYGDKTLVARWDEDKNTDGIPDKYQVLVTYKVENGTWADGTAEEILCVYDLYEQVNGIWTRLENVTLGDSLPTGMKHGEAYDINKPGSWSEEITADTPVPEAGGTYTFTFGERWGYNLTVSVLGGSAKVDGKDYEKPVTILHGDGAVLAFTPNEGWILDSAVAVTEDGTRDITLTEGSYTLENVTEDVTIQVRYSVDQWSDAGDDLNTPDGIPDSRQAVFQFRISGTNATLTGKTIQVVTLEKNQSGEYAANMAPETVTVAPAPTYRLEKWVDANGASVADPFASRLVVGGSQYVYTAFFHQLYSDVHYQDADRLVDNVPQFDFKTVLVDKVIRVDPNGGSWHSSTDTQDITVTQDITLETPAREGYLFRGWKCEPGTGVQRSAVEITYTFTAQWLADGDGKEDGGDGIPDIYQKKVIFRIENGIWGASGLGGLLAFSGTSENIVHYLTLTDANGNWSQTGTAYLEPLIPTGMRAKWGYGGGKWDVTPPDYVSGTDTATYTYRFEAKNLMNPKTGDDSTVSLWLMAMLAALAALVCLILTGKRKQRFYQQ